MCVNRPALCIGIHMLPNHRKTSTLVPKRPHAMTINIQGINHIEPICLSCNVGFVIEDNQCCTHQGHDCTIRISLSPEFAIAILNQVEAAG
jgi:hypothetical protein